MAYFEPPSFSLGLDLDSQSEPPISTLSQLDPAHQDSLDNAGFHANSLDELQHEEVMGSDPEPGPEHTRVLKRLRRGTGSGSGSINPSSSSSVKMRELERSCGGSGDDDIEEFSSQEDLLIRGAEGHPPAQHSSVCSSSKIPLRGHGVSTTQSSSQWKARKTVQASDAPSSASLETSHCGLMFPKLTISPLRKFQLLDSDSDSDHPSVSKDVNKGAHRIDPSSKQPKSTPTEQKRKVSVVGPQNEDLWKDFCPVKRFPISTPVLDEVCEEYFQSVKNKNAASTDACVGNSKECHTTTSISENFEQCWDASDPLPPAHHYFFHDDPRIQQLVRTRLPHFSPLGIVARGGNHRPSASVINYMNQFSNGEASKQKGNRKNNSNRSSTKGRDKSKKSSAEKGSHASEGWVDPRSSSAVPKDAGKRRVHASGQSAGHWYTSPEGRKVYVSRSGQELSGQIAYRQYRKESGAGFRRPKKKTSSKKKKAKS